MTDASLRPSVCGSGRLLTLPRALKRRLKAAAVAAAHAVQRASARFLQRYDWSDAFRRDEHLSGRFRLDQQRFAASAFVAFDSVYRNEHADDASQESMRAIVTMEAHRIEKALSMPERRAGAGQDAVVRLSDGADAYHRRFGDADVLRLACSTATAYRRENPDAVLAEATLDALRRLARLERRLAACAAAPAGGFLSSDGLAHGDAATRAPWVQLLRSRHSVRSFAPTPVPRWLIDDVARDAIGSPSVCNRQEWRLYAAEDRALIQRCLSFQNGNRGFGHLVPLLFAVCVDLRSFVTIEERNQGWIDGGMFAMSLLLGLHARGLGACPLNWCATPDNDRGLREALGIPDHEIVIMLVAAGYPPDHYRVAMSSRRPVEDILQYRSPS